MKLHLVHKSADNKLAVIGFFFQVNQTDNKALESLTTGVNSLTAEKNS